MGTRRIMAIVLVALAGACARKARVEPPASTPTPAATAQAPAFLAYKDYDWKPIVPELGTKSPEIAILHVDPVTHATQLMIRTPAPIHVRKHWHSANETHTILHGSAVLACDGGRPVRLDMGGFNFMPARMVHEAWLPTGSLTFITVDGAWDIHWIEGPPTAADLDATPPSVR